MKRRTSKGAKAARRGVHPAAKAHAPARKSAKARRATVTLYAAEHTATPSGASHQVRQRDLDDTAGLSAAQLLELYRHLYETRRLEEHLVAMYRQNQVIGGVYRSLGQEATAVGCVYALRQGDLVQPLIRDLGAALTHGVTPIAFFRQYMAKATGPSGGRDLNAHFSGPELGILGPVSMLGAMVPVLAGCLLAARLQQRERAGLCFIGDGGSSTGAFYEGVNFAAVQRLPMITVIEANHYAYSTPTTMQVPDGDLVRRARGFGCTVMHIDGNDVLACYEATREARARGVRGEGPTLIVAETYRRKGHAEHDNQKYVPEGEIDDWATNNDPLERYVRFLVGGRHLDAAQLAEVRAEVDAALEQARAQALTEPQPEAGTQQQGVFADGTSPIPPSHTWWRGGPPLRPLDVAEAAS